MVAYADTSFLFSLYAQGANTARAAQKVFLTFDARQEALAVRSGMVVKP